MIKEIIVCAITGVLLFSGCGNSNGNDSSSTPNNDPISNIGKNINGKGYYGDNVKFGDKILNGKFNEYVINENGNILDSVPIPIKFMSDGSIEMLLENGSYFTVGIYGVNENGTILNELWTAGNYDFQFTYLGNVEITMKATGEVKNCMKEKLYYNNSIEYYALCNNN